MSRLDDLIDLIQTTNEVYFITAPGRVRTAFILVDDIIELALKTFLQEKALEQREQCIQAFEQAGWVSNDRQRNALRRYFREESDESEVCTALGRNPASNSNAIADFQKLIAPFPLVRHWSANKPDARNTFESVIDEVKAFFPPQSDGSPHPAIALLDAAQERHRLRNNFYHDQTQAGLTINDERCLRAMCEMFDLMEYLFPDWLAYVQANNTVRCQIGVLRTKLAAQDDKVIGQVYDDLVEQLKRTKQFKNVPLLVIEHFLIHADSYNFLILLQGKFDGEINNCKMGIHKIDNKKRRDQDDPINRANYQNRLDILEPHLTQINRLI